MKRKLSHSALIKRQHKPGERTYYSSSIILILCFLSLLFISAQRQSYDRKIKEAIPEEEEVDAEEAMNEEQEENLEEKSKESNSTLCRPKQDIVFLKTHKCASSSLQNIFMRYGYRHNLTFVLPIKGSYIGHPKPFSRSLVPDARRYGLRYSILTHHCRFNYVEMRRLLPHGTVYITVIRHPVDLFESMFSFYGLNRFYGERLESLGKRHEASFYEKRLARKLGFNQMLFDLGFDDKLFSNMSTVTQYVHFLDSIFDLVLVSERMEESLVLLRDLLCWDIDDVIAFKLNARNPKYKKKLNSELYNRIAEYNKADLFLYRYFTKRFDERVQAFGVERMEEAVQLLRNRTLMWYGTCVQRQDYQARIINTKRYYANKLVMAFVKKNFVNDTCDDMTAQEPVFTEKLHNRQKFMYPQYRLSKYHRNISKYKFRMHRWRYRRK